MQDFLIALAAIAPLSISSQGLYPYGDEYPLAFHDTPKNLLRLTI